MQYEAWCKRPLADREPVYLWADGIYVKAGLDKEKAALLVVICAHADGRKEILCVTPGYRESKESWGAVFRDLRDRGLACPPWWWPAATAECGRLWPRSSPKPKSSAAGTTKRWRHLRTTNPVESPFAAVRLRTGAARRFRKTENATCLIWKVLMVAEKNFRRVNAPELMARVRAGEVCKDGLPVTTTEDQEQVAA